MTDNQMLSASARMSPVSDPQQFRLTAVGKRQGLPQDNQRLRLKKLADGKTSKIRILTLNVGSMTGRGREIAAVLKERKIDIAGVQETKWKGSKAKMLGDGFKLFYHGETNTRNGVGIILGEKLIDHVLQVNRKSDRIMRIQMVIAEKKMRNLHFGKNLMMCYSLYLTKKDWW